MAPTRQFLALLALAGAAFFLLACGSSDEPTLEGEPFSQDEQRDLTGALTDLETAFDEGDCEGAQSKLTQLKAAVEAMPEERDAELRDALTSGLDDLGLQIDEECQQEDESTSTTSSESSSSTVPTETTSTSTTTTTTDTEDDTDTSEPEPPTPPEETPPETPPGQGGTPPGQDDGSGGTSPGSGGFEADG